VAYNKSTEQVNQTDMYNDQYKLNSLIIKHAALHKPKISKFVFISSAFLTRPSCIHTMFIESIRPNALFYKSLLEFHIQRSGLNHLIIRPGKLIETPNDKNPGDLLLSQGDKIGGFVSYHTLSYILCDMLMSENCSSKNLTVELAGPGRMYENRLNVKCYEKAKNLLKEDKIINSNDFLIRNFQGHVGINKSKFKFYGLEFIFLGLAIRVLSKFLKF
jgi:hypothetical protein